MTVTVDRVARQAADFEDLAAVADVLDDPVGRHDAHRELVFVDHHDILGVQNVVERHQHDVIAVRKTDHAVEAGRADGDGDDGVEALVDEVLDRAELGRGVRAGRDDAELGDQIRDFGLLGKGLGRLDHLNAPDVADKPVDHGDLVRPFARVPAEVGRILGPGCEALRVETRAFDDIRIGLGRADRQSRGCGKCRSQSCESHVRIPPVRSLADLSNCPAHRSSRRRSVTVGSAFRQNYRRAQSFVCVQGLTAACRSIVNPAQGRNLKAQKQWLKAC